MLFYCHHPQNLVSVGLSMVINKYRTKISRWIVEDYIVGRFNQDSLQQLPSETTVDRGYCLLD